MTRDVEDTDLRMMIMIMWIQDIITVDHREGRSLLLAVRCRGDAGDKLHEMSRKFKEGDR